MRCSSRVLSCLQERSTEPNITHVNRFTTAQTWSEHVSALHPMRIQKYFGALCVQFRRFLLPVIHTPACIRITLPACLWPAQGLPAAYSFFTIRDNLKVENKSDAIREASSELRSHKESNSYSDTVIRQERKLFRPCLQTPTLPPCTHKLGFAQHIVLGRSAAGASDLAFSVRFNVIFPKKSLTFVYESIPRSVYKFGLWGCWRTEHITNDLTDT